MLCWSWREGKLGRVDVHLGLRGDKSVESLNMTPTNHRLSYGRYEKTG